MTRIIGTICDVVNENLCCGCGACYSHCEKKAVALINDEENGIHPLFSEIECGDCKDCLSFCPGCYLNYRALIDENMGKYDELIGPYLEIYEGYAKDEEVRYKASSGGVLTAISLFCLEEQNMEFVLHTGMDKKVPWLNETKLSRTRKDVLENAGSRYAPSSPCDSFGLVQQCRRPSVFIGKPCDAAAAYSMRRMNKKLDGHLGLVLSFFCAGPPVTKATLSLLRREGIDRDKVSTIRYRGYGWPGMFSVCYEDSKPITTLTYQESWGYLAKQRRPFRCGICPDGMGDFADISCGDAWDQYSGDSDPGRSVIIVRTRRGKDILSGAVSAGYIEIKPSSRNAVLSAQRLQVRRKELYGRMLAMRILAVPVPNYDGFPAYAAWRNNTILVKVRILAGTLRRIMKRFYRR